VNLLRLLRAFAHSIPAALHRRPQQLALLGKRLHTAAFLSVSLLYSA
jgi:hypothetical protein